MDDIPFPTAAGLHPKEWPLQPGSRPANANTAPPASPAAPGRSANFPLIRLPTTGSLPTGTGDRERGSSTGADRRSRAGHTVWTHPFYASRSPTLPAADARYGPTPLSVLPGLSKLHYDHHGPRATASRQLYRDTI